MTLAGPALLALAASARLPALTPLARGGLSVIKQWRSN